MDFRLPEIGEGVYEAELVSWLVRPGQPVRRGQALAEVLTDKATMEVPSPFAGTVTALAAEPGQAVQVGQVLLSYEPAGSEARRGDTKASRHGDTETRREGDRVVDTAGPPATSADRQAAPSNGSRRPPVKASPSVRYMARKLGIDLAGLTGSGPQGRVLIEDLSAALARPSPGAAAPERHGGPDFGTPGTRIKVQGLRRKIAEHMVQAKRTAPHYTYVDECDVSELVRLRQGLRQAADRVGVKVTYLPFLVKAVTAALKDVPLVNATLDEKAGEIVLFDHYHVGIAVAAPQGLIVPVVRDADKKDLFQIAREIDRLSAEARAGRSRLDDLRGSTFTITSIGGIGGLFSTPVLNYPEVGILGVGKVLRRPVFDEAGNVRPADLVYLSLSFDHRVVDGAVGAAFANAVIRQLQCPAALLVPV